MAKQLAMRPPRTFPDPGARRPPEPTRPAPARKVKPGLLAARVRRNRFRLRPPDIRL